MKIRKNSLVLTAAFTGWLGAIFARLQPYIRLLDLTYPVDDLRFRVNAADDERGPTSNAELKQKHAEGTGACDPADARANPIAVHRLDDLLYYRRLVQEEYLLVDAISRETPIGPAIEVAFKGSSISEEAQQKLLEERFANWARLGWLCPINSSERNDSL